MINAKRTYWRPNAFFNTVIAQPSSAKRHDENCSAGWIAASGCRGF
jgi:hypothetical protein